MPLSYNQIIQQSRLFQQSHYKLKNGSFGNGLLSEEVLHNQIATFKNQIMWMEDSGLPLEKNIEVFAFRVSFVGPIPTLKDRGTDLMSANENEMISDMRECAKNFLAYWVTNTNFPNIEVELNAQIQPLRDVTPDRLYGVYMDIRFRQDMVYDSCVLPMAGVPAPENPCPGVFIYIDDVFTEEAQSGTNYYFTSGGSQTYEIITNGQDAGDLDFDGTDHTINFYISE